MFAESLVIGAALLVLAAVVVWGRRAVLRSIDAYVSTEHLLLDALKVNADLLAIDRHRPDTTEEQQRLSGATLSNYQEIQELRVLMADLTIAVDTGVRHVQRAEKRVARTVQSARKQLKERGLEHSGLEAEADELRDLDGEEGDQLPMQLMSEEVGEDEEEAEVDTGIPGFGM